MMMKEHSVRGTVYFKELSDTFEYFNTLAILLQCCSEITSTEQIPIPHTNLRQCMKTRQLAAKQIMCQLLY